MYAAKNDKVDIIVELMATGGVEYVMKHKV